MKSCIDCFNCKVKCDKVRCSKEQWAKSDGEVFEYKTLPVANKADYEYRKDGNNGYLSYARFCQYYQSMD